MDNWKKIKNSGNFKRKVKNNYLKLIKQSSLQPSTSMAFLQISISERPKTKNIQSAGIGKANETVIKTTENYTQAVINDEIIDNSAFNDDNDIKQNWLVEFSDDGSSDNDSFDGDNGYIIKDYDFRKKLQSWAINFNVRHWALKELFKILNERIPNAVPSDPRTLLQTRTNLIPICNVANGQYWHQGLTFCIQSYFRKITHPMNINININIDGLPLYKSSKDEFWPILFNIKEIPDFKPMVIGIYWGKKKPSSLKDFLTPFVEEMLNILRDGVFIRQHKIGINIRCFICDSPARAFIKGIANFNSQHGCGKCTTVGEYSHISRCNIFPRTHCPRRTDAGFRAKIYESHHKTETPLERLPIDMVECFPAGDDLHLIHLGIVKRILTGLRDGSLGSYRFKWSAKDIDHISNMLINVKLPTELHRKVRGLDCLAHWKGLEYRTFLLYVGIVVLKDNVPYDLYEHFLALFCAITILSSDCYAINLHVAEALLDHYVETFIEIFGKDYVTSNVHNICHITDEVRRYGNLTTFDAYPFESMLYQIKNLLRNGHNPLTQAARRINEITVAFRSSDLKSNKIKFPTLKKKNHPDMISYTIPIETHQNTEFYSKVLLEKYMLSTNMQNKWILTHNNEVVGIKCFILHDNVVFLCGSSLKTTADFFETPINSSHLNVWVSTCDENVPRLYSLNNIKCKLVAVKCNNRDTVFIPLLHTL